MPTKIDQRSSRYDRIQMIHRRPPPALSAFSTRTYSSSSNIPSLFPSRPIVNDSMEPTTLTRPSSSLTRIDIDHQRKELDDILQHLYEGKLLSSSPLPSACSSSASSSISQGSSRTDDDEMKTMSGNSDLDVYDGSVGSLQRELREKDLDIRYLQKEIEELKLDKKLLEARLPVVHLNPSDSIQRENEFLRDQLRRAQESIIKIQGESRPTRVKRVDQSITHEKEMWTRKIRDYEKQLRQLTSENDKFKQICQQSERMIEQLKRDNQELQTQVNELIKRNDQLFLQEFHTLRQDLKLLKEKNHHLDQENLLLKQRSNDETKGDWSTHPKEFDKSSTVFSFWTGKLPKNTEEVHSSTYYKAERPEITSVKRPYIPLTIKDIRLNDVVKFSRPGGKVSKGTVKYTGLLPDRSDFYLGLELEEEDTKHDGVFQGQRFFQCKANKGVFVGFNKVIMAWTEK